MNEYELIEPSSTDTFMTWLTEFALGQLNNKLTSQVMMRTADARRSCAKLTADRFDKVVKQQHTSLYGQHTPLYGQQTPRNIKFRFDIMVHGFGKLETFNAIVTVHNTSGADSLELDHWTRVSVYERFNKCKDKNASVELCVCSNKANAGKLLREKTMFNTDRMEVIVTNSSCLSLLKRSSQDGAVLTFELENVCHTHVSASVRLHQQDGWRTSNQIKHKMVLAPYTLTFISTFMRTNSTSQPPFIEILNII